MLCLFVTNNGIRVGSNPFVLRTARRAVRPPYDTTTTTTSPDYYLLLLLCTTARIPFLYNKYDDYFVTLRNR